MKIKLTLLIYIVSIGASCQVSGITVPIQFQAPKVSIGAAASPYSKAKPNNPSTTAPSKVKLNYKMASHLSIMSKNKDKQENKKSPQKLIIKKKFHYNTFYHLSKTDKLVQDVLDTTILYSRLKSNHISFLNMIIRSMNIKKYPSTLEKELLKKFTSRERKKLKDKIKHPFYQKLTKELFNVEKIYRDYLVEAQKLKISNQQKQRYEAVKAIADNTNSVDIIRDIKRILRAYFMAYTNIQNARPEVIEARKKSRIRSPKRRSISQMKTSINQMYNSIGFKRFYYKAFYLSLSRLSKAEILEGVRISKDPLLKRFFKLRHQTLRKLMSKTRTNAKRSLFASVNLKSYTK